MRGRQALALESESGIGSGKSSRNRQLIQAGIYYPPGSAKARFCVERKRRLYEYCEARGVEFPATASCSSRRTSSRCRLLRRSRSVRAPMASPNHHGSPLPRSGDLESELNPAVSRPLRRGPTDGDGCMLALQGALEQAGGTGSATRRAVTRCCRTTRPGCHGSAMSKST